MKACLQNKKYAKQIIVLEFLLTEHDYFPLIIIFAAKDYA